MARTLGVILALGALAACSPTVEEPDLPETVEETSTREVLVTAAFSGAESTATALTFLPNADAASLGLVVSAPREGGLDLYDADGARRAQHPGERLSGLAAAPGFQLRGEALPLIFGAAPDSNTVRGFAVVTGDLRVLDLPLGDITTSEGVSSLCLFREGTGFVDLAVLGTGPVVEIWRVRDSGGETLSTEQTARFSLEAPARSCASFDGDLYLSSPAAGISRLDPTGAVIAQREFVADDIAVGEFNGARLLIASSTDSAELEAFTAFDLEPYATIDVVDGLSTPGVNAPGALAITEQSYGFTAYSAGLVSIFDRDDTRVKVISREAFARAMIDSE